MEPDSPQVRLLEAFLEMPHLQILHIQETAHFVLEDPGRRGSSIVP